MKKWPITIRLLGGFATIAVVAGACEVGSYVAGPVGVLVAGTLLMLLAAIGVDVSIRRQSR